MSERLTIILQPVRRFARWWFAELGAMVPAKARERLSRSAEALVITLDGSEAAISHELGGKSHQIGRGLVIGSDAAVRSLGLLAGEPALQQRVARGKLPVCIRLPADKGLRTQIMLPAAVEENLAQVLHFELDRRTP